MRDRLARVRLAARMVDGIPMVPAMVRSLLTELVALLEEVVQELEDVRNGKTTR